MIGYTVAVTLIVSCLLAAITMVRLFRGKPAGIWGRATGVVLAVFAIAFILWAKIEVPAYEKQQAKINYTAAQEYLAAGDNEKALQSLQKITKGDKATYDLVQPTIEELKIEIAQSKLDNAKSMYNQGQYQEALAELQDSIKQYELDESKSLLPIYKAAAAQK